MVKILLVSATVFEIEPTLLFLQAYKTPKAHVYLFRKLEIEICITKVGMVNTAFELGKLFGRSFDLVINAGVAGSFGKHQTGEVLNVAQDCFSELGAEDDQDFLGIDLLGLGEQKVSLLNLVQNPVTDKLPKAHGITVNTVHGNEATIEKVLKKYQADVETMEGAAFIHAANASHWQAIQLRAISNKVEKRNKNNWQMPLAIKNLNAVLIAFIENLDQKN